MTQSTIPHLHHLTSSQSHRVLWALEELSLANPSFRYNLTVYPRVKATAPPALKEKFPLGKSPILTVETVRGGGGGNEIENSAPGSDPNPDLNRYYQIIPNVLTESRLILQFLADNYSSDLWRPSSSSSDGDVDGARDIFFQEFANSTLASRVNIALVFDAVAGQLPPPLKQLVALLVKPIVGFFVKDQQGVYRLLEDSLSDPGGDEESEAKGDAVKSGTKNLLHARPYFSGSHLGLADINMSWGMDMACAMGYFVPAKYPKLARWRERILERPAYQSALRKGGEYDLVNFK